MGERVKRFDVGRMDGAEVTAAGYLRANAYATRIGVFAYKTPDGTIRREARLPEHVFAPESIRTLECVPITDKHPDEPAVNSRNARKYQRGSTGDRVTVEGDYLKAPVAITDQELIDKIFKDGVVEVSCGYECYHEEKPGVFQDQPYDVIQCGIVYNHLAVVEKGRAGPMARLRLDSADAEMIDPTEEKPKMDMVKITIEGKEVEVPKEVADYIAKLEAKDADAEVAVEDSKKALAEATAETEKAEAKADALEAELKKGATNETVIAERVKARLSILNVANAVLPADKRANLDSMSDLDIQKEIIMASSAKADLKDKGEVYIKARFDAIVDRHVESGRTFKALGDAVIGTRKDSAAGDAAAARKRSAEASRDAWKKPLAVQK